MFCIPNYNLLTSCNGQTQLILDDSTVVDCKLNLYTNVNRLDELLYELTFKDTEGTDCIVSGTLLVNGVYEGDSCSTERIENNQGIIKAVKE